MNFSISERVFPSFSAVPFIHGKLAMSYISRTRTVPYAVIDVKKLSDWRTFKEHVSVRRAIQFLFDRSEESNMFVSRLSNFARSHNVRILPACGAGQLTTWLFGSQGACS